MKYGLNGSSHENVEASQLIPAIRAKTGTRQQSDAIIAVKSPTPINSFSIFILFPRF